MISSERPRDGGRRVAAWGLAPLPLSATALGRYASELGLEGEGAAVECLARALATGPGWERVPGATLLVRRDTPAALAVAGRFDDASRSWLAAQLRGLEAACRTLRHVTADRARGDSADLARRLVERLGAERLSRCALAAVPRGGRRVLEPLRERLTELGVAPGSRPDAAETVVVDDCGLTGAALRRFLDRSGLERVIFAPLYAPRELGAALERGDRRVVAVVAGRDLAPVVPEERVLAAGRAAGAAPEAAWRGVTEFVTFDWNEPDRAVWDPAAGRRVSAWRLLPPDRPGGAESAGAIPVEIQPAARGAVTPAPDTISGRMGGFLLIASLDRDRRWLFDGAAADLWQALLERGGVEAAVEEVAAASGADREIVAGDAARFLATLEELRLVERRPAAPASLYGLGLAVDPRLAERLPAAAGAADVRVVFEPAAGEPWVPAGLEPLYESPLRRGDGKPACRLYRAAPGEVLRFPDEAEFLLAEGTIRCRPLAGFRRPVAEIQLLGSVLAYWLERHGVLALHASAVEIDGRAVALLAGRGGGKTTLAAELLAAGHRLVTDDLLAVRRAGSVFRVASGAPWMRLHPADAQRLLGRRDFERVHPDVEKLVVPVAEAGLGAFQPAGAPLAALYLLARAAPAGAPAIEPLGGHRAAVQVLRHSYSPYLVEAAGLAAERLERLGRLLEAVPVRRLTVPRALGRLPAVRDLLVRDLAGIR